MKQTVLIAGLGLIGGSLAINIQQNTNHHVIGYDVSKKTLEFSLMNGIIDEASNDFESAIVQADFCILAAPVSKAVELVERIKDITFEKPIIITDVSSVKSSIMEAARLIDSEYVTFIGGHPMAGSHKKGIHAAKGHLFENAIYVLSPLASCSTDKMEALKMLLSGTKCKFLQLNPKEHDEMTSVISHFPHLIASSLVHQAKTWQQTHAYIPKLAAGGFRDITRIASSNPAMWQDIFFQNSKKMQKLLEDWIEEMQALKNLLETNDKVSMYHYLEQAKEYRDGLDTKKKGAIPAFYDLYVDIADQPGALLKVIELLANKEISINNIEILEIREGITGVLRLSFQSKRDQAAGYEILTKQGYETMIEE
ncbi:prephenate dehydrogenase [Aquibacillus koreensis]|uniref:Prephenate dehydrogenase n=1 Tax=Aquibacillus koreensis TaxID=279446 RepID=A0A9X4AGD3_9BACI|nr:prephenate dehydrogenase [Aquibacillus koreensis]MCT2537380.1 prephenate dehydrogenase [Aquibacillus koreensis]MDC3418826.1 prephenate dehydrogenase [Aquibacillus koreensis]